MIVNDNMKMNHNVHLKNLRMFLLFDGQAKIQVSKITNLFRICEMYLK